ncbi:MAG: endolytic transglycosylase MltG [Microthrixaceae bacterium]
MNDRYGDREHDYDDHDYDHEYVLLPRDTSGGRKVLSVLVAAALIIGVLAGGTLLWASRQIGRSGPQGDIVASVTIPSGASVSSIATILEEKDIISSARIFKFYTGLKNEGGWKAGKYVDFRTNSSFDEAIEVLDAGPVAPSARVVRVIEGSRLADALRGDRETVREHHSGTAPGIARFR